jgi:protein subunit release factor A
MAQDELKDAEARLAEVEQAIKVLLLPPDP